MQIERNRSGNLRIAYDLATQIAKNLLMGSETIRNWRLTRPRTSVETETHQYLKRNAFCSLDFLREHIGDLTGRSVCEIGAGDHLTSGLSILGAGASRYGVIDRFPGDYSSPEARRWYRAIRENWNYYYPEVEWLGPDDTEQFPESAVDRLELIGKPLEEAFTEQRYDILCSFQVGEHVSDIDAFAKVHNKILAKNGVGLHRVDFGPHDVWFHYRDPGVFLRFSDRVWRMTGSNRGVPNRKRHHEFLAAFEGAGLKIEVLFTEPFDPSNIDLGRLNKKFRSMPIDSVLTGTAIYRLTRA